MNKVTFMRRNSVCTTISSQASIYAYYCWRLSLSRTIYKPNNYLPLSKPRQRYSCMQATVALKGHAWLLAFEPDFEG